jgi:2-polyprenyl-6-methoxyphenol hydroxylase-like FAD-dependent oxidoreductase
MADVLVVGAGPVGLTMAAELARHGVRCRIVDKLEAPSGYCKAIGVTPRTLEVWEDMGSCAGHDRCGPMATRAAYDHRREDA